MKKGYIHIVLVLDRSGSMHDVWNDTIGGVNRYLDGQRGHSHCTVTLAQFDEEYELIYNRVPIADVAPRTRENYVPRGWTALHDAMGSTIDSVGLVLAALPESERPERVLFVTMTDGHENRSRIFNGAQVRAKVEHQRKHYGWEFVFLGANQDAILTAGELGIMRGATMTYAANAAGTAAVMDSLAVHTASYGATGQSVNFSSAERRLQAKYGAHQDAANDPSDTPATGTNP
ncbi:MAG TPA: hypothetical protein VKO87_01610 [Gemmatimonadaceae bacterium]|nr:hypothetical protein [Gemmatimonadaceae bacterium]